MTKNQANRYLALKGHPELELVRMFGVWYVLGGDSIYNRFAERCLHVTRIADVTFDSLDFKIDQLTSPEF